MTAKHGHTKGALAYQTKCAVAKLTIRERVVCFLSLYYDYIAMAKFIDIKYSIYLYTRTKTELCVQ